MEAIIAVTIAVLGWLVNHYLSIRAQEKSFINQVKNEARSEIINSLRDYLKWLGKISREEGKLHTLSISNPEIDELLDFERHHFDNFINLFSEQSMIPYAINVLEEYETLFPQTKMVREYLREKHIDIFFDFREVVKFLKNNESISLEQLEDLLEKPLGFKIGAQKWIVKDFIICIQNLSLGEITGKEVIPKEDSVVEIRHPRLLLDRKKNITITKGKYDSINSLKTHEFYES